MVLGLSIKFSFILSLMSDFIHGRWGEILTKLKWKLIVRDTRIIYIGCRSLWIMWYAKYLNQNVVSMFEKNVKRQPKKICFLFEDEKWTLLQVQEKVNQIANFFQKEGYKKGDKVGLFMENSVEFVCIWLGLAKIGVISALINHNLRLRSLEQCLKAGSCKGIIFGAVLTKAIEELKDNELLDKQHRLYSIGTANKELNCIDLDSQLINCSKDEPMRIEKINHSDELFYIYTSGTTGLPKAAVIRHSRYLFAATGFQQIGQFRQDDVIYTSLPLYHTNAGVFGIGQAILFGNTVAIGKKFSASRFWTECIKYNATVFQYIGEICRYLLTQPVKPEDKEHKIRQVFGNGLRAEIWEEFVTRFNIPNVCEFYGSTEGNCNMVNIDNTVGAVGYLPKLLKPLFKLQLVHIDKNTGKIIRDPNTGLAVLCADNEPGELVGIIDKRHPYSDFDGYTDLEAKRKKIATNVLVNGDMAFRSGDVLVRDANGYFYFLDRQGDTFRWKGENVSTSEVENVVTKACGLKDCAVYGVSIPGADGKAGMAAIADPTNSIDLIFLAFKLSAELPTYARPLFIRIVKEIEMTGTYKFKKVTIQKEGFDINKIKDPVYVFINGKYELLDNVLYNRIISARVRL